MLTSRTSATPPFEPITITTTIVAPNGPGGVDGPPIRVGVHGVTRTRKNAAPLFGPLRTASHRLAGRSTLINGLYIRLSTYKYLIFPSFPEHVAPMLRRRAEYDRVTMRASETQVLV